MARALLRVDRARDARDDSGDADLLFAFETVGTAGRFDSWLKHCAHYSGIDRLGHKFRSLYRRNFSVPKGQTEAGLSLGLDELTTMTSIVLPQAVRNVLPALCNEFISLIKESSVLFYIGVQDLTAQALGIGGTLYDFVPPLIVAAIIYFILTFLLSQGVSVLEKKMGRKYSNGIV